MSQNKDKTEIRYEIRSFDETIVNDSQVSRRWIISNKVFKTIYVPFLNTLDQVL